MKIVFAGTPEFAAVALDAIIGAGHTVIAAYTQPDRPAGRGKKLMASPVKQRATAYKIPIYQPLNFKEPEACESLLALQPDLMIVAAYGLILPQNVLNIPTFGCINIHASLLPRWRGAAPIQRAIQAGDTETGITIMQMDIGLDTGDMLIKQTCAIDADDNAGILHDRLAEMGGKAILEFLDRRTGLIAKRQNNQLATYAHKLSKREAQVNWQLDAESIVRSVRAFNPWPVAFTETPQGRVRILEAERAETSDASIPGTIIEKSKRGIYIACGKNSIRINRLQIPGGKPIDVSDFVNGGKALLNVGDVLTIPE